jgi:alkyldihydroxyacetonephosphate synthase
VAVGIERSKLRWNGWGWAALADEVAAREEVWSWFAEVLGMPSLLVTPPRPFEEIAFAHSRLAAGAREYFVSILGADRVRDEPLERASHAGGRSYRDLLRLRMGDLEDMPDAVLYPRETDEILKVLAFADEDGIAVVPFGGGTSVVGGVSALPNGFGAVVTLDLSGMDRVVEIDSLSGAATAEAGIDGPTLEKALAARSLTLGHYPQSFEFSTLGGWIAHRGAGQLSNRYGGPENWLISAKLATPKGLLASEDFPASAAGPRLTDLIVGSEGAFGVITEAKVRVRPVPEARDYQGYLFRDFASGITAVRQAMREEIQLAMLRLSDADETNFYRAINRIRRGYSLANRLGDAYLQFRRLDAGATLLIAGFEGSHKSVATARRAFRAIANRLGAIALGNSPGERWLKDRFQTPYLRDSMLDRSLGVETLETAAIWSKLPALYAAVRIALDRAVRENSPYPSSRGIVMCHLSHSYPEGASLYFTCIFPRSFDGGELARWQAIKKAASDAITAHGGTISHHHGVGVDHLPWMSAEKSPLGIEVLRAIKRTVDPRGVLNPGKLIPPE